MRTCLECNIAPRRRQTDQMSRARHEMHSKFTCGAYHVEFFGLFFFFKSTLAFCLNCNSVALIGCHDNCNKTLHV